MLALTKPSHAVSGLFSHFLVEVASEDEGDPSATEYRLAAIVDLLGIV